MIEVEKNGDNITFTTGWKELIDDPVEAESFKEAFANADSLIDSTAETLLRSIYDDFKCQDLINEIHHLRGSTNFEGLAILKILKSKTIISSRLLERAINFKKARNLVLHNLGGVHDLLTPEEFKQIPDEDYKNKVIEKAKMWLEEAKQIDFELSQKFSEIESIGNSYYFSDRFYKENPRINEVKKSRPSDPKQFNK